MKNTKRINKTMVEALRYFAINEVRRNNNRCVEGILNAFSCNPRPCWVGFNFEWYSKGQGDRMTTIVEDAIKGY